MCACLGVCLCVCVLCLGVCECISIHMSESVCVSLYVCVHVMYMCLWVYMSMHMLSVCISLYQCMLCTLLTSEVLMSDDRCHTRIPGGSLHASGRFQFSPSHGVGSAGKRAHP